MDSTSNTGCRLIAGLRTVQDQYHGFLIDAWGVLHDGESLYPYALDCLFNLRKAGKRVIILSNAARRSTAMVEELGRHNIQPEYYQTVLTSGELAWQTLQQGIQNGSLSGLCGYYLGPPRSRGLIDGLDLQWVDDTERADFILNTGAPAGNPPTTADSDEVLAKAASRDIPMICANPDQIAIRSGQAGISAGALAKRYDELGARKIEYHGKPFSPIYSRALAFLDLPASQVLAIGDAFETDIRGGQNAGLDTCLITAGIHHDRLLPLSVKAIQTIAPSEVMPNYASEYLAW